MQDAAEEQKPQAAVASPAASGAGEQQPNRKIKAKNTRGRTSGDAHGNLRVGQEPSGPANLTLGSSAPGVVINVRETFGFLRPHSSQEALFFHASELLVVKEGNGQLTPLSLDEGRINLAQHVGSDDQVQFIVGPGQRGSRFTAKQVRIVAKAPARASADGGTTQQAGTPPLPLPLQGQQQQQQQQNKQVHQQQGPPAYHLQGTITKLPDFAAANWRARQEDLGGIIWYSPADSEEQAGQEVIEIAFGASHVAGNKARLSVGDRVSFLISERWDKKHAEQVQIVPGSQKDRQADGQAGPRLQGFVYSFNTNSGRGNIRRADGEGQLSFTIASVAEESQAALTPSSEVEFSLGKQGRKDVAVAVKSLSSGTIKQEENLPGRITGRVVRVAAVPQGQTRERPGAIRCDDADLGTVVSFTSAEVQQSIGEQLREGDDVEFSRLINRRSGAVWAVQLTCTCRASDRRELGQISVLKPKFGFIKCCERRSNMFFHFDALSEGLTGQDLTVGDDVEFSVGLEPRIEDRDPRPVALRVAKAPPGSAVFETVSEEKHIGQVLEKLQINGFKTVQSGVLEFKDASGQKTRLTFDLDDLADSEAPQKTPQLPQHGDRVFFRIAMRVQAAQDAQAVGGTAARHAGRRATEVEVQRFKGTCYSIKGNFGFITCADAQALGIKGRLYFHAGDLQGPPPTVNQQVTGTIAYNQAGETIARGVLVIPGQEPQPPSQEEEAASAPTHPQRPKMQLKPPSGAEGSKKPPAARIAAMPDGTKGFTFGRGRGLPAPFATPTTPSHPPGSDLKTSLSGRLLSPTAAAFVPSASFIRTLSQQSAGASDTAPSTAGATPPQDGIESRSSTSTLPNGPAAQTTRRSQHPSMPADDTAAGMDESQYDDPKHAGRANGHDAAPLHKADVERSASADVAQGELTEVVLEPEEEVESDSTTSSVRQRMNTLVQKVFD